MCCCRSSGWIPAKDTWIRIFEQGGQPSRETRVHFPQYLLQNELAQEQVPFIHDYLKILVSTEEFSTNQFVQEPINPTKLATVQPKIRAGRSESPPPLRMQWSFHYYPSADHASHRPVQAKQNNSLNTQL